MLFIGFYHTVIQGKLLVFAFDKSENFAFAYHYSIFCGNMVSSSVLTSMAFCCVSFKYSWGCLVEARDVETNV